MATWTLPASACPCIGSLARSGGISIVMTAPMVDYKIHWLKMMSVPESRAVVGRHDGINGRDNPDRRLYAVPFWSAAAGSTGRFSGGLLLCRSHSAGFSQPRTTQRGKNARRRKRNSTTTLSATLKSAKRPRKKSVKPTKDPGDEAWVCSSLALGEIRGYLVEPTQNGMASRP